MRPRMSIIGSLEMPSTSMTSSPLTAPHETDPVELEILRHSLEALPYTAGVHPVKEDDLILYYDVQGDKNPRRIDLGKATEEELAELMAACDPTAPQAHMGGKMNLSTSANKFATRLDVVASGLLDAIRPDILAVQDADVTQFLRAELSQLDVYGPGSSVKANKATARGDTMISYLVVIFPTAHTGSAFTLEHGGMAFTFDSTAQLASASLSPALAYIASYTNVEHTLEPVRTGYRVTLTYNLFLSPPGTGISALPGHRVVPANERAFEDTLRVLLSDPTFLHAGGVLAYGLVHKYSMPTRAPAGTYHPVTSQFIPAPSQLRPVLQSLEGRDARICILSESAGLEAHVKLLYNTGYAGYVSRDDRDILMDDVVDLWGVHEGFPGVKTMQDVLRARGVILRRGKARVAHLRAQARAAWGGHYREGREVLRGGEVGYDEGVPVHWVTHLTDLNHVRSEYTGEDSMIQHVEGNAGLFVHVPAFGEGVRAP
ncbi:hypothetical protein B0H10DRAFT_1083163 [Mycena sp. CBHHK59/15]|nr:hypothetical protein B0H10DRAFT_1083163 [Mycena sp. CBHHK59/15]